MRLNTRHLGIRHLSTALVVTPAIAIVAGLAVPAAQGSSASTVAAARGANAADPYGRVWNILPPGQSGTITASDLAKVTAGDPEHRIAVDGENAPDNFADQLEMYDALNKVRPHRLKTSDLATYYKRANFTPGRVVAQESPRPGVDIAWDQFGVPYVTGSTYDNTMFGAGYSGTRDRMFLMDLLRHAGAARLAEFAGDTPSNVAMDREQLRSAFYTPSEAARQAKNLPQRFGAEGVKLLGGADAFLAGINAAQEAMCPAGNVLAPDCPAEYAALQKTPEPWTRADLTYVASLVGGIFGKGGGAEYDNAIWLQRLQAKFGDRVGRQVYNDLREKNDLDAPTTSSVRTPYGGGRIAEGRPGVALPDLGGRHAPGTGAELPGSDPTAPATSAGVVDGPFGSVDLSVLGNGMSNALLIGADHTKSGHPITVFGPQTGYYTPQLLTEEVLSGPGVHARGVSFAGTQLVVELGRGTDYAWSATSASNDLVDTVVERLCNADGSEATIRSNHYVSRGRCVPMDRRVHQEDTTPSATGPGQPHHYEFLVLRTRHGIVQTRTTVAGRPVAIVLQRSTYGHEVDSIAGFSRFNNPNRIHDAGDFQRAADQIDYTFNWFYTDDRDIAYFSSGRLPIRAPGVDFDLPRWGDVRYDWKGWLPFGRHVHQVNPPQGFLVSWNNKTAPGFSAADDVWGYGSVYRSLALSDRARRTLAHRKVAVNDVVGIVADAATVDSRARYTLPQLLRVIGSDPRTRQARTLLRAWLRDGAHRVDRDRDGHYAHEQAIALFDDWWQHGRKSVAYDVIADRLGGALTHRLPSGIDNHPRGGRGSSWNGVAWYGYLNKDLTSVLDRRVSSPYRLSYCGRGSRSACRDTLRTSLRAAVQRVLAEQGKRNVGGLRYDKSADDIRSVTAGTVGTRRIDWQNRPTFQQVVAFTDHRNR